MFCFIFLGCESKTRSVSTLIGTGGGGYSGYLIAKEMGKRTLVLYIGSVMSASIMLGYGFNLLVEQFSLQSWIALGQSTHEHGEISPVYALCAVLLGGLMLRNGWQALQQKMTKSSQASCCH